MEKMRINRYLAGCQVASRRKSEELVKRGLVRVNGEIITDLSFRVDPEKDRVFVNNRLVSLNEDKVYYMLNKPAGVISASRSKYGEPTVVDLIGDRNHRLFPVGRLDKDTTGLILVTNDGDLTYRLTHPSFETEKTYEALVRGRITSEKIEKLKKGVVIDGRKTSRAKARLVRRKGDDSVIEITLIEGRKRQVKKMCEKVGHRVLKLKRIRECGLELGDLEEGSFRPLRNREIRELKKQ